jgi:uncharacterized membrane protein YfcA
LTGPEGFWQVPLLLVAGLVAGFVNTLAGGGSLLTIPLLMLLGLPAQHANATNRIGVFLHSLAGGEAFHRHGLLDRHAAATLLPPALAGALAGALAASQLPATIFEPVLLAGLALIALTLVWKPRILAPTQGAATLGIRERPFAAFALFGAGFWGGFLQAGVGIFLLASFSGLLRFDLVRANALKVVMVAAFTGISLLVFIAADQIVWLPGLVLAAGSVTGARLAVRFAVATEHEILRRVIFGLVLAALAAVWLRSQAG